VVSAPTFDHRPKSPVWVPDPVRQTLGNDADIPTTVSSELWTEAVGDETCVQA